MSGSLGCKLTILFELLILKSVDYPSPTPRFKHFLNVQVQRGDNIQNKRLTGVMHFLYLNLYVQYVRHEVERDLIQY